MKGVALVSGGIDSPVAAYLLMRKGVEVIPLLLDLSPFSFEENKKIACATIKKLSEYANYEFKAYIIPHGENLVEILKKCPYKFTCLLCRRMMFRIAERLAEKENADMIITGEFLGSKASQTAKNLFVVTEAVKIPIVRPLIGMNKEEITEFARKIGTYEISSKPGMCCTVTPSKPSTHANLQKIIEVEQALNINHMVENSIRMTERFL